MKSINVDELRTGVHVTSSMMIFTEAKCYSDTPTWPLCTCVTNTSNDLNRTPFYLVILLLWIFWGAVTCTLEVNWFTIGTQPYQTRVSISCLAAGTLRSAKMHTKHNGRQLQPKKQEEPSRQCPPSSQGMEDGDEVGDNLHLLAECMTVSYPVGQAGATRATAGRPRRPRTPPTTVLLSTEIEWNHVNNYVHVVSLISLTSLTHHHP